MSSATCCRPAIFLSEIAVPDRRSSNQHARYYSANPGLDRSLMSLPHPRQVPDVRQLLTIAGPNVESITEPHDSVELAQIANDEMAALVANHPDRVHRGRRVPADDRCRCSAARSRPRDSTSSGFCGVEIFTYINGKPVDAPEFCPDLRTDGRRTICRSCSHPRRTNTTADYAGEPKIEVPDLHELRLAVRNLQWRWPGSHSAACIERFPNAERSSRTTPAA